jgi:ADP-ribose pyrophosphatase YjhB (NUDIX family)
MKKSLSLASAVQERSDGLWTLPGGWADVNDSPSEAVEREIVEESGFRVKAERMIAVFDRAKQGNPRTVSVPRV